jgi:serine/threonine protein kinase
MIGRTVSHYRILSPLGSGGMGVVYLAEDSRLGRQVALKFLPATWSQESRALERFRVEARAASALSHPAICAIYDIGQDGDTPFIVMEALKGETLRERILRGPLKIAEVLDIGIQLADGLEAAHEQGIVHRDIKPANIFLGEKNRVKVLDFGLAKLTSAPSSMSSSADTTSPIDRTRDNQMTQPGTALGTVSYMSPEQARGEQIDSRTDLFSLGAVLYEMVTGSQAFGGSTTAVVYDAILNRTPRPIAHLNPLVPARLETVIATALEKDRELRHQHASDLEADLRRIRRDLDSGSLAGSQVTPPSHESMRSASATAVPPAQTAAHWPGRTSLAVALVALLVVAALFWRAQGTPDEPVQAPAPSAPAEPASQSPTPVAPGPPPLATNSAPAPESQAVPEPAPPQVPQPRPRPAPPVESPPVSRGPLPLPPPAAEPANSVDGGTARATPAPSQQPAPAVSPPAAPPVAAPPAVEEAKTQPAPPAAPVPEPAPPPPAPVQAPTPAPRAASTEPSQPPSPAAESDDAAIRRVIRTYEQAIETKDLALFRSIRPNLTRAAETTLMNSFRQIDSQEIDIRIESLRIDGRTATARLARRDTLITAGRRQVQNITQTLRFEKTESGWIISE